MELTRYIEAAGQVVDAAGVTAMVGGVTAGTVWYAVRFAQGDDRSGAYRQARRNIGRSILFGLELLVAGDIIRTVAVSPSFTSVGVLAAIVVIRTFLSFTLELEITGRWPWQHEPASAPMAGGDGTAEGTGS